MNLKMKNKSAVSSHQFITVVSFAILVSGLLANIAGFIASFIGFISSNTPTVLALSNLAITAFGIIMFAILLPLLALKKIKNRDTLFKIVMVFYGFFLFPALLITVPRGLFVNYLMIVPITYGMVYDGKHKWTAVIGVVNYMLFTAIILYKGCAGQIPTIDSLSRGITYCVGFTATYSFALTITHIISGNLRRTLNLMEELSFTDELTGVANRRRLDNVIESRRIAFGIMLDIDYFKHINDTYGHQVGDVALKQLADIVGRYCSDEFKLFRFGGEEFFIVSRLDSASTVEITRAIVQDVRKKFIVEGEHVTISCGIGKSIEEADAQLYKAKENGRNQIWYDNYRIHVE